MCMHSTNDLISLLLLKGKSTVDSNLTTVLAMAIHGKVTA